MGKLTEQLILKWADAYHRRTGNWPNARSGPIPEGPPGETWYLVNQALIQRFRTLPPGGSLARLLAAQRGKRNPKDLPKLTVKQILAWADAHFTRTGQWPTARSGSIAGAPGESWGGVQAALQHGGRGFDGGDTLYRLLVRYRRIKIPA